MSARRLFAATAILTATLVASSACGGLTVTPPRTPPPTPSHTAAATPTTSAPRPSSTTAQPTSYPGTAQGYAQQVLSAWAGLQAAALADLTTPDAQTQLRNVTVPPSQAWTFQTCDGAAGSSYCSFASTDGDVITLRVSNTLLGQAHATVEARFDPTVYNGDPEEYVRAFVEAWRNGNSRRMLALANQNEVDYFTHATPPGTYDLCALRQGDLWQVRIFNPAGLNYQVRVTDGALGTKHAIAGHTDPVSPPLCS